MFCSRCGLRVEKGNCFCQGCGQEVGVAVVAAPAAPSATPSSNPATALGSAPPQYAGFWVRFVAYFLDGLILGIPRGIAMILLFFHLGGRIILIPRNPPEPAEFMAFFRPIIISLLFGFLFYLLTGWLYFAFLESSARQATLGKSVMSLRVTDAEGRRISFGRAAGRFFAKIVSSMIPLGIGFIMAGFTAKKQALHDFIAGTLVMRK